MSARKSPKAFQEAVVMPGRLLLLILMIITLAVFGCSSGGGMEVTAPEEPMANAVAGDSHYLWGLWQFHADPVEGTLDAVQVRMADMHLNAMRFLEPPPYVYLTVESLQFNGNIIEVDIGLRHPFLGLNRFTGFDVCGVLITSGSITGFSDSDLVMAGIGDTRLLNADGYTRWWNPAEFPVNEGTMFSYQDGLLGQPDSVADYNCTLNGYKYFCDDLDDPADPMSDVTIANRGMFSAGQKNVRHYTIEIGGDGLIFNYAVDANWKQPTGSPPWDIPGDFPPVANRPEPWRISVTETENTLYYEETAYGGDISLSIDVYDWYNADANLVRVEAPGVVAMTESSTAIGGGAGYSTYEIEISGCSPSAAGDLDLLITIESDDVDYGGLLTGETVSAYFIHTTEVADEAPITDPWSEEFIVLSGTGGRFPVIAQTPNGDVIAAWSQNPGVHYAEFTFPDTWGTAGTVSPSIDAIRMSIEPGLSGDDILITTQRYGGTTYIAGVPTEYGDPLLYMWDGSTIWDEWATGMIHDQIMHHTMIDFQGKFQWYWGTRASYGHPIQVQYSNWQQGVFYDYAPNYYYFGYPNCSELGYSRCWDDDSSGNAYVVFEWDRMKNPYQPPVDQRGLFLGKQFLPNMTPVDAEYIIENTTNDACDSPSLAIDSDDRVHVAYRRYVDSTSEWQIVHRWSDGGTSWNSTNETIVWSGTLEPEWRYISLDIDSQDRIHLTFWVNREILYTRSDNGTDWLELEWVNESSEGLIDSADYQQWMFVDADDQVHVVWARIDVTPSVEYGTLYHRWRLALP